MIIWAFHCIKDIIEYDLTTFQILGLKFVKFFVGILVQTMTLKGHLKLTNKLTDL